MRKFFGGLAIAILLNLLTLGIGIVMLMQPIQLIAIIGTYFIFRLDILQCIYIAPLMWFYRRQSMYVLGLAIGAIVTIFFYLILRNNIESFIPPPTLGG